jgi:LysR family cys regulon transcriptional activator
MNFQQLRTILDLTRNRYSVTEVAHLSRITQPGVSRQIRDLEGELGVAIFERDGKRITGLSEPGKAIVKIVDRLMIEADQLRRAGTDFGVTAAEEIAIAASHTQARYALPQVVQGFRERYPNVRITLQQSTPEYIVRWLLSGVADIGIASDRLNAIPELVTFPAYRWQHQILVPDGHPLLDLPAPALADLARYPLITYDRGFTRRCGIDPAFEQAGLRMNVALTSMDSDVIKQYVSLGMGVGLIASMAHDSERDAGLQVIDSAHLFEANTTWITVRRGAYLRASTYEFILRFAPHLTRQQIDRAINAEWQPDSVPKVPNLPLQGTAPSRRRTMINPHS